MTKKTHQNLLAQVEDELQMQHKLWGNQRHTYDRWMVILMEEVGELAQAILSPHKTKVDMYGELIQVAAVAVHMMESMSAAGFSMNNGHDVRFNPDDDKD